VVTIPSEIINSHCDNCFLTTAVYFSRNYPMTAEERILTSFEIEVTQRETMLFPGNSKIGSLD